MLPVRYASGPISFGHSDTGWAVNRWVDGREQSTLDWRRCCGCDSNNGLGSFIFLNPDGILGPRPGRSGCHSRLPRHSDIRYRFILAALRFW